MAFSKLKIDAAKNNNGHWIAGIRGQREDSELCWWHVKACFYGVPQAASKGQQEVLIQGQIFFIHYVI